MHLSKVLRSIFLTAVLLSFNLGPSNGLLANAHKVQTGVVVQPTLIHKSPKAIAPVIANIDGIIVSSNTSAVAAKIAVRGLRSILNYP